VSDRIPALIVSGFLGSGKTSLVRHLLAEARERGLRMGIVSNEFGELGIDALLLERPQDDYVELSGGCVCCRLSDALVETLQTLWERARPDRVVVETSGVALPFETQLQLWRDPVRDWVEDDVAVVVVNAEQLLAGRDLDDTFCQQVSSADLLLLNQVDRVEPAELPGLEARLRELEPEAPIVRATHGRVDPALLFPPDASGVRARRRDPDAPPPPHAHESFETEVLRVDAGDAAESVLERVRALGALRAKGFVETSDGLRLLQGVGPRVGLVEVSSRPPEALLGRIVAIRRTGR
jgi:cobalamin biosynthesis protein CobW